MPRSGSSPQEMQNLIGWLKGGGSGGGSSYAEGSLPKKTERLKGLVAGIENVLTRSKGKEIPAASVPPSMDERLSLLYRQIMNSPATLAGLGVGLSRGADFGPGPSGSILASFPDEGTVDPQTLGDVMLLPERLSRNSAIQTHELGHVRQGRFFGPLLPAAAGVGALWGGYEESPFEGPNTMEMGERERRSIPSHRTGTLKRMLCR